MAANHVESNAARVRRPLQAAACIYRIAFCPRAGQKVLTVQGARPRKKDFKQTPCADMQGFSLHAAVRCGADDRQALEQPCRYTARPALSNERVQTNAAGQGMLKTAWRDGTAHLVMSPMEFMQRLAVLVSRSRLYLIRFWCSLTSRVRCADASIDNFGQAARADGAARGTARGTASTRAARPGGKVR